MKKILLVSASKVFLTRNSNLLIRRELILFTATSGKEALKIHEEFQLDLILADFKLEDMDGSTLCSLVKESLRHVPVVLICHNIPGSIERVEQSGASAMLIKPIDPIKLLVTIGSLVDLQLGRSKRVDLKVRVLSKKQNLDFFCFSHDISNSGILLATELELLIGSRIICQFALPGSGEIETEGKVVRYMIGPEFKNLYGVKFIDPPLSCRRAIDNYISSAAGLQGAYRK